MRLVDDFTGGLAISAGAMGETGWSIRSNTDGSSTTSIAPSESSHPGVVELLVSNLAAGAICTIMRGADFGPHYDVNQVAEMWWVVKAGAAISGARYLFGFTQDSIAANLTGGTACIAASYDNGLNANWRLKTRSGGTDTFVDTGVPVVVNKWYLLKLTRISTGNWLLTVYTDGAVAGSATSSTNVPSGLMQVAGCVNNSSAVARAVRVDLWRMFPAEMQRF